MDRFKGFQCFSGFKGSKVKMLLVLLTLIALAVGLISCGDSSKSMNVVSLKFEELSLPANPEEEKMMRVSPAVLVTYDDGRVERHPLSYVTLYKSGDKDAQGNAAGQLLIKTAGLSPLQMAHRGSACRLMLQRSLKGAVRFMPFSTLNHHQVPYIWLSMR